MPFARGQHEIGRHAIRLERRHLTLRHFLGEAAADLTNLDGRLFGTLRALVLRPGALTRAYFTGRRTRYLTPLQIFLLCNVVFFFVQSWTGARALSTPLDVHLHHLPYRAVTHEVVFGRAHREGEEATPGFAARERGFDAAVETQSRTLVVLMVPLFALCVGAVVRRRLLLEHLVFSLHFYAFVLLATAVIVLGLALALALVRAAGLPPPGVVGDAQLSGLLLASYVAYLVVAIGRVYDTSRPGALVRGAALGGGIVLVLVLYRFILFFTAYYLA